MAYGSDSSLDLILDVMVLAAVIAFIPKQNMFSVLLLSFLVISIVAMESRIRGFRLTGYMDEGMRAFRPIYWATAILLLTFYYRPPEGLRIWDDQTLSFFMSTMLVFLAMLFVSYRAAAH